MNLVQFQFLAAADELLDLKIELVELRERDGARSNFLPLHLAVKHKLNGVVFVHGLLAAPT